MGQRVKGMISNYVSNPMWDVIFWAETGMGGVTLR